MLDLLKSSVRKSGKDSTNLKSFWLNYFEKKATLLLSKESHEINGFLDKKLVTTIRKKIRKLIKNQKHNLIFDFGCGDGSVTAPLVNENINVIGIDISPKMCEIARQRGIKSIEADIDKYFAKNYLDLLIEYKNENSCLLFCESLGCSQNPIQTVQNISESHDFAKTIIISLPNPKSLIRKSFNLLIKNKFTYFKIEDLDQKLVGLNFIREKSYFVFCLPFIYSISIKSKKRKFLIAKILKFLHTFLATNIIAVYKKP